MIKFPRVIVSTKRHATLEKEAKKRKVPIAVVAEEKFLKADKNR